MKRGFLSLVLSFVCIVLFAQVPPIVWQKSLGGTAADEARSVQPTSDGGYIIGGTSLSNNGNVSGNHGGTDCWVVKLSATGSIEWQKTLGGTSNESFGSVRVANDGGYIMSATTYSNNGDVSGNHGSADAWVVKLNNTGTLLWQKCFGSTGYDSLQYVEETIDGGYIAMGASGLNNGDLSSFGEEFVGGGWIFKLSSARIIEWQKSYSNFNPGGRYFNCIRQTTDGGYAYGGYVMGSAGDAFIYKVNGAGTYIGGESLIPAFVFGLYTLVAPKSVVPTADGGCVIAYTDGNTIQQTFRKYSSTMAVQWTSSLPINSVNSGGCRCIAKTSDGGYFATGTGGSNSLAGYQGGNDFWAAKLTSTGIMQWQRELGSAGNDDCYWGEQASDGGYVLVGSGAANSGYITGNHGGNDFWVAKLSSTTSGFTITSSTGANGAINPEGATAVNPNANQSYTITPNANYHIANVLVDGVNNAGAVSSGTYTFTNVTTDHSVSATFVLNNAFLITSSAGANGTISPSGSTTVFSGNNQVYTITPAIGYRIANVLVDGVSNAGAISSGTYTFTNVTAAHSISATFTVSTYTITASASTGGSVNPPGATQVNYGGSQYYTFSRLSGYDFTDVLVDGVSLGPVASYNFSNVTANHTISATFTALQAAPPVQWQKSLGGTADDFATSVQPTSDGGYIVGGTSSSNDGNVTGNHGGTDYWVTKLNSSGGIIWQKSFGGGGSDALSSIRTTSDGGYILSGTTNSSNGDVNDNHAAGIYDGWVLKLSSTGNIEWKKCYGGTGIDYLNYIEQTADGGYIAVGNSPGGDGNTSGSLASGGAWLMKLNSTGAVQWQSNYGSDAMAGRYAGTVTQTSDGGYIVGATTAGISKMYTLIKFNASGNAQWEWYPNNELSDIYTPKSVKQTSDGGYIFVAPGYLGKFLAVKLSSTGTTQWRKELGGTNFEIPGNAVITSDGGYLLTGYTYSNDGYVSGNHGAASTGDYWVVKMNSAGTVQWQKALGGTGNDEGYWGEQTSDGYILAGKGATNSGYITGNHGGNDFWIVKLSNTTGFTLTSSAGVNGTITPEGSTPIVAGGNQSYTITPNANYHIDNVLVDGVSNAGAISTGTYTFSNVNADHTISASFILNNSFPITASTGANGTISPIGTTNVAATTNQIYTFTPNANYHIANVLVDGVSNTGAISSGTYTFTNVVAPHTISVTFTINTNTITATAGAGGTISPVGAVQVPYTSGQSFSFVPNTGFTISNVLVDGVSVGTPASYNFFNVTAPHAISVSFAALLPSPNIIWQRSLGGTGAEEALSIQPTNDGGFIVGGTSNSNNGNVSGNHGGTDYWVAKLNSYGTIEWQRSLGGSGNETFQAVRKTSDDGYIVVGYTNSNDGDVSGNHGNNDAWIVKLSSTGTTQWQRCHGNISNDFLSYIEQTSDGGYIAVGEGASYDGDQSGFEGGASWIVKMGNTGTIQWQKSTPMFVFGAGNYVSYIHQASDGGYIATGNVRYGGPGVPDIFIWKLDNAGAATQYLNLGPNVSTSPGTPNVIQSNDGGYVLCYPSYATYGYGVMKLSSTFNVQWTKNLAGDFGIPGNIVQAQDGGYLITGTGFVLNPGPTDNHGGNDLFVAKLTANGVLEWQKSMGGTGNESGNWGDVLTPGNYIAAGSSTTDNGDVTGTHGSTDFWVVKYGIGDTVITASAGANGTISPLGKTRVSLGGTQTYTITPNSGYNIVDVLVDGVSVGTTTSYTFNNVTTSHTIAASFVSNCTVNTWAGTINNDWNNPGNWSCNALPSATSTIIINTGTPYLNQNFTVANSLTIGGTGSLTVDPTYTLTISGAANFGGRPVIFRSTIAGTSSLGQVTGTLTGTTNVTVERYIPNNGFRSWRLLSVPTYGSGQTIRQAWQEGDINPLPLQNNLPNYGTQITGVFTTQAAATAAGFDSTSVQAAMLSWNGTGWSNVTTTNQPIANQKSWFVFVRGERSQGVTGNVNNSTATTLRTRGTVYVGDQTTNVGANAFALVPNLYPSAINFTGLTRIGGVNNMFYIWDSKKINGNSLGTYQTFSATNGFIPLVGGGSYPVGQPNTTIESGQSFFVTSGAAGTVVLKESAKISGTNGNLGFRPVIKSKIDTRLYNSSDEMLDANAIVFDAAYSKEVADEDAPKLGNPGANFAIETNSKLLAIEGTRPVKENDVIQFKMWNLAKGIYTLELIVNNIILPTGLTAMLEDSYLQTSTAINLSEATKVKFEINSNAGSSAADRFKLVFGKAKPVINDGKQAFTIAPNPIEDGVMNVSFKNQAAGKYSIRLAGAGGQSVMMKAVSHAGGNATQNISLPSGLASGTYTVEIVAPDKTRSTQTVVVNRK